MGENTTTSAPVFHLTDRDKEILARRDEDYDLLTWEGLRQTIGTGTPTGFIFNQ
jgi:hypothetical protein